MYLAMFVMCFASLGQDKGGNEVCINDTGYKATHMQPNLPSMLMALVRGG